MFQSSFGVCTIFNRERDVLNESSWYLQRALQHCELQTISIKSNFIPYFVSEIFSGTQCGHAVTEKELINTGRCMVFEHISWDWTAPWSTSSVTLSWKRNKCLQIIVNPTFLFYQLLRNYYCSGRLKTSYLSTQFLFSSDKDKLRRKKLILKK